MPATSAEPLSAGRGAALVVGGAKGIGRAIARALAERGDDTIVADVDSEAAAACAGALVAHGLSARAVGLDVTDVAAVREVVARIDAETPLETVVANAGIALRRPLVEVEPEEYDALMAVNVRGVFLVVQAALRALVPRGRGSVVTVCSTSGFTASTGPMAAYDASKGAVRLLTQSAAREVGPSGVRVNAVAPGTVETELTLGLASREELVALGRERVPLGRLGAPEEIAAAVAFLASPAAAYVTGHVLVVDGGWLA
ncbi:MAG: SDR family oxidoreductase [Gaiellaceae bacterium MAG52_C11]|nr:SDR family oxidoreductase [Candidatus Gaiellasilicea maunaloa]